MGMVTHSRVGRFTDKGTLSRGRACVQADTRHSGATSAACRAPCAMMCGMTPNVTVAVPLIEAVAVGVVGVLGAVSDALVGRQVCEACGCLCNPFEVCPGCRAKRMAP